MTNTIALSSDKLESIFKRIEYLEAETVILRRALQRLLGDDDQAYYWTPAWQQGEAIADEQYRSGDFMSFENGEELIDYVQGLVAEAE